MVNRTKLRCAGYEKSPLSRATLALERDDDDDDDDESSPRRTLARSLSLDRDGASRPARRIGLGARAYSGDGLFRTAQPRLHRDASNPRAGTFALSSSLESRESSAPGGMGGKKQRGSLRHPTRGKETNTRARLAGGDAQRPRPHSFLSRCLRLAVCVGGSVSRGANASLRSALDASGVDTAFQNILTEIYRLMNRKQMASETGSGPALSAGSKISLGGGDAAKKKGCC